MDAERAAVQREERRNLQINAMRRRELYRRLDSPFIRRQLRKSDSRRKTLRAGKSRGGSPIPSAAQTSQTSSSAFAARRQESAVSVPEHVEDVAKTQAGVDGGGSSIDFFSAASHSLSSALRKTGAASPDFPGSGGSEIPIPHEEEDPSSRSDSRGHGHTHHPSGLSIWERSVAHEESRLTATDSVRNIVKANGRRKTVRNRGGFPTKWIYPMELMGMDTLMPS